MMQVLQIATAITSPLALLGLVAAFSFYAYSRRLKHDEQSLKSLPAGERTAAVDRFLSRYKVEAGDLSKPARERLIKEEMDKRYKIIRLYAIISATTFVVCFLAAVLAFVVEQSQAGIPDRSMAPTTISVASTPPEKSIANPARSKVSSVKIQIESDEPVVVDVTIQFHTTRDDKDSDTALGVSVLKDGETIADGEYIGRGVEFSDHSASPQFSLGGVEGRPTKKEVLGGVRTHIIMKANGNDSWWFKFDLNFRFSDGTSVIMRHEQEERLGGDRRTADFNLKPAT